MCMGGIESGSSMTGEMGGLAVDMCGGMCGNSGSCSVPCGSSLLGGMEAESFGSCSEAACAPTGNLDLGEFYGIVRSIFKEKGYGFIVCDALKDYEGDVYVHISDVGHYKSGDEVKFTASVSNGRLHARDLSEATGMAGPQKGFLPGEPFEEELGRYVGTITGWYDIKGYGFIHSPILSQKGYPGDVFLHNTHRGIFRLGMEVSFTAVLKSGKIQARDLADPSGTTWRGMGSGGWMGCMPAMSIMPGMSMMPGMNSMHGCMPVMGSGGGMCGELGGMCGEMHGGMCGNMCGGMDGGLGGMCGNMCGGSSTKKMRLDAF
eukprot:TRINITY_DN23253_c0_g1_i2.p1 TRINITY_DN23253_c0_g1~~TRINITY_DN23253_c0_g1_i2.p1  ORF type:complete len:318 (+),score=63.45 TRINITY_DN23253_c0_g1_i2:452-1405(+)